MIKTLTNTFRIPELRNKLLFTLGMLVVYRIGYALPLPGVNAENVLRQAQESANTAFGALANYMSVFSGGDLSQSRIFGLGIMPYISASIILQLLATVVPSLEKLKKEGEPGIRKINEWTRYLTVLICLIQGGWWMWTLASSRNELLYPFMSEDHPLLFWVMGLTVLTAGSMFLMWLGEQIDQYGIGNGVSLIITAGIVSRLPNAIHEVYSQSAFTNFFNILFKDWHLGGNLVEAFQNVGRMMNSGQPKYGLLVVLVLAACFVFVVAGSILITQAQRRIPIQQAKHLRGRKVYGGQKQYLPLRVNHAGVMPIIFASSLMLFPHAGIRMIVDRWPNTFTISLGRGFDIGEFLYEFMYIGMIFFFSYFWNTVQFQPKEMANQLRDYGSFIPGLRPGPRTAEYLENVMNRMTYVGAAFLCVIAVIPSVVYKFFDVSFTVSSFLGGTGLLIVISVMLDLVNRIEANLVMRNYGGFLEDGGNGAKLKKTKGGPVRGSQPAA